MPKWQSGEQTSLTYCLGMETCQTRDALESRGNVVLWALLLHRGLHFMMSLEVWIMVLGTIRIPLKLNGCFRHAAPFRTWGIGPVNTCHGNRPIYLRTWSCEPWQNKSNYPALQTSKKQNFVKTLWTQQTELFHTYNFHNYTEDSKTIQHNRQFSLICLNEARRTICQESTMTPNFIYRWV